MDIGYNYNSRKVLVFIATEGDGSTESGYFYLYHLPDIYYNVSLHPVVCPLLIVRYYHTCNVIDNHNRMQKSDLALDKYWVAQSGYFRLATIVALGMCITDWKLLLYHVISEVNVDKKISTRYYNNIMVYDLFNNTFTSDCGIPYLNPPPITIYYRSSPHKRAHYSLDLIPDTIYVASKKYVSNLTTPYDLP